jgi:hypothetical protein
VRDDECRGLDWICSNVCVSLIHIC